MKGIDIKPSFYVLQTEEIDIWSFKQEHVLHEQQMGKYSFIVIENRKKDIIMSFEADELSHDSYINE